MARYVDDFYGIVGHDVPGRGMDPNYRGGYRGMRMQGGPQQAEYGMYRLGHPGAFAGSGGPAIPYSRRGPARGERGYDAGWGTGGVRDLRYDRELLHEFNANSPGLERSGRSRDMQHLRRLPRGVAPWRGGAGNRPGYSNRGLADAGYSEGWAWGPMRGAR